MTCESCEPPFNTWENGDACKKAIESQRSCVMLDQHYTHTHCRRSMCCDTSQAVVTQHRVFGSLPRLSAPQPQLRLPLVSFLLCTFEASVSPLFFPLTLAALLLLS